MLLDLGRYDAVLDLYDTEIRAERTDDYRDISNATSLLMRLELDGIEVGDRWAGTGRPGRRPDRGRQPDLRRSALPAGADRRRAHAGRAPSDGPDRDATPAPGRTRSPRAWPAPAWPPRAGWRPLARRGSTRPSTTCRRRGRRRDLRLDFFRGIAMFIILFAHTPGNFWTSWIPARFGFSDATEIFVFCSGMASALAFGGNAFDRGWPLGTARVLSGLAGLLGPYRHVLRIAAASWRH
jgi:hypothetical protein